MGAATRRRAQHRPSGLPSAPRTAHPHRISHPCRGGRKESGGRPKVVGDATTGLAMSLSDLHAAIRLACHHQTCRPPPANRNTIELACHHRTSTIRIQDVALCPPPATRHHLRCDQATGNTPPHIDQHRLRSHQRQPPLVHEPAASRRQRTAEQHEVAFSQDSLKVLPRTGTCRGQGIQTPDAPHGGDPNTGCSTRGSGPDVCSPHCAARASLIQPFSHPLAERWINVWVGGHSLRV